jgi:hypothetical protein
MTNTKKARAKWTALLAIAGASVCGVANAGPMTWTDYYDFRPDVLLGPGDTKSFTHDITDGPNGFNRNTDNVSSYQLVFDLYDDRYDGNKTSKETAVAWLGSTGQYGFNLSGTEYGGWTLIGALQLELTGRLTVAISSLLGDFYLGSSTLTVKGTSPNSSSVPEPGTLALFGTALLGFGLIRRKRAARQA